LVLLGSYVPQVHCGYVEDGEAGGVGRLPHHWAYGHRGTLAVEGFLDSRDLLGYCRLSLGFLRSVAVWRDLSRFDVMCVT
jgi:hypothetical protein